MRKTSVDENGMKKGAWSEEEDEKLRSYILKYGHWNWRLLPKFAGLARCGKSCRLRWVNYLKPGLKRGNFTKEEEHLVAKLHDEFGKKWSAMAARIPGRTDNEIKNFWHTHLKKRSKKTPSPSRISACKKDVNNSEAREISRNSQTRGEHILESSGTSESPIPAPVMWDSEESDSSSHSVQENLFSEEQVVAENYCGGGIERSLNDENYEVGSSFWSEPFLVDTDTSYGQDRSFPPLMEEEEAEIYLFT